MAIDKTKGDDEVSKERIVVVPELPTQPTNKAVTEEGEKLSLMTISEALTEIYADIKAIKKAVA
jgi:hypothetical protein